MRIFIAALIAAGSVAVLLPGCRSCGCGSDRPSVGRVVSLEPVTELTDDETSWRDAVPEARLYVGGALKTGERGRAELELTGPRRLEVSPRSLVRFTEYRDEPDEPDPALHVQVQSGSLNVEAADDEAAPMVVLSGPGGRLRLRRDTGVRVTVEGEGDRMRIDVVVGLAELEHSGETTEIPAGDSLVVTVGLAELERLAPRPTKNAPDATPADSEPDAGDAVELGGGPPDAGTAEGVRVRAAAGATVELRAPGASEFEPAPRRNLQVEPGTAVRVSGGGLTILGPSGASVALNDGAEAVVAGQRGDRLDVRLRRGGGAARSEGAGVASVTLPGGRVETSGSGRLDGYRATVLSGRSSRVNVTSGLATVHTRGRTERVETGAEIILGGDRGLSILPPRDVFPILSGGSALIHDPRRTGGFTVRFPAIEGCERYLVEVDQDGSRLLEAISSRPAFALDSLPYGAYRWRAACLDDEGAATTDEHQGRVARRADQSGNVTLPTKVPRNSLDSSGRQYTVTYQNRLPAITLRWSKAPEASGYRLDVFDNASGRRMHSAQTGRPAWTFRSGFFQEGSYYWIFRAEGPPTKAASPLTRMRLTFDNQMPSIQILEPREGAAASGSVRLRGLVSVGSTVSVNGVALDLGGDFRFDQTVPVGPGNLLVFRVATPRRGTALYLRHLGAGGE